MRYLGIAVVLSCCLASPAFAATRPAPKRSALELAREAASIHDEELEPQLAWAMAAWRAGAVGEGWDALGRAIAIEPDLPHRLEERASLQVGDEPRNPEAWFRLGTAYMMEGDREAARRQFEHAAALAPGQPWIWDVLGWCQAESGHPDQANASWQHAIQVDQNRASSHYLLSQALYRQGRLARAAEELAKAQKLGLEPPKAP